MDIYYALFHINHVEDQTTLRINNEFQNFIDLIYLHGLASVAPNEKLSQAINDIHNGIDITVND